MREILAVAYARGLVPTIPAVALAEVWRGDAKDARVARLLKACSIEALDERLARAAGRAKTPWGEHNRRVHRCRCEPAGRCHRDLRSGRPAKATRATLHDPYGLGTPESRCPPSRTGGEFERGSHPAKTGRSGRRANPDATLDRLLEALMEPTGRMARRRAVEAIRRMVEPLQARSRRLVSLRSSATNPVFRGRRPDCGPCSTPRIAAH